MPLPHFRYEKKCHSENKLLVAGVDEVGVGTLAGPVVAAAVILPATVTIKKINDSKKLSQSAREHLDLKIRKYATAVAVGEASVREIDALNILEATRLAMRRALLLLHHIPEHVLVDARTIPDIVIPQTAIVRGDQTSITIAAASIVAKVARDEMMRRFADVWPQYGFEKHKGYGTKAHLAALKDYGPCPIHRYSFAPVKNLKT